MARRKDGNGVRIIWSQPDESGLGRDLWMYDSAIGKSSLFDGNAGDQNQPAMDGDYVVWSSSVLGNRDVFFRNLGLPGSSPVNLTLGNLYNQEQPDISGDWVVWSEYDPDGNDFDVCLWNVGSGSKEVLTGSDIDPNSRDQRWPRVYAREVAGGTETVYVVWEHIDATDTDVYLQERTYDPQGKLISVFPELPEKIAGGDGDQFEPDIQAREIGYNESEHRVAEGEFEVWVTYTDNQRGDLNLFAVPLNTQPRKRMALPSKDHAPSDPIDVNPQRGGNISGRRITWIDRRTGFDAVYMFDFLVASTRTADQNGEIQFSGGHTVIPRAVNDQSWIAFLQKSGEKMDLRLGEILIEIAEPR
jgi:hypothetical protein